MSSAVPRANPLFSVKQMAVIDWAAVECRRQRSNELSVAWMLHAWQLALTVSASNASQLGPDGARRLNEDTIKEIGRLVEPYVNARGYREVGVRVGSDVKLDWRQVPRAMANLVAAADTLDPDEWFYEYENIHPWRDGNGRSGSILWNWLRGSLAAPEEPPEFWGPREQVHL